jgi:uncharacterized YccA/Bax inhibitor family protein
MFIKGEQYRRTEVHGMVFPPWGLMITLIWLYFEMLPVY